MQTNSDKYMCLRLIHVLNKCLYGIFFPWPQTQYMMVWPRRENLLAMYCIHPDVAEKKNEQGNLKNKKKTERYLFIDIWVLHNTPGFWVSRFNLTVDC